MNIRKFQQNAEGNSISCFISGHFTAIKCWHDLPLPVCSNFVVTPALRRGVGLDVRECIGLYHCKLYTDSAYKSSSALPLHKNTTAYKYVNHLFHLSYFY